MANELASLWHKVGEAACRRLGPRMPALALATVWRGLDAPKKQKSANEIETGGAKPERVERSRSCTEMRVSGGGHRRQRSSHANHRHRRGRGGGN